MATAMVLSLSACGSSSSGNTSSETPASSAETPSEVPAESASDTSASSEAPADANEDSPAATAGAVLYKTPIADLTYDNAVYGGTLRIGNRFSGVNNIGYPYTMAINSSWEYMTCNVAIETLGRYDSDLKLAPWLAESWDVDQENLTITLHLRPDVTFHDGTEFNAEAVVWNYEQYTANGRSQLNNVDSYEIVDDLTVIVHLSSWSSTIEDNLLYNCGWMISPTAVEKNGADWASANPVGTGPFVFDEWVRDVGVYFNKNENYWMEGRPFLDRVEICIYSDVTALSAALSTNAVDCVIPADATVAKAWAEEGGITEIGDTITLTSHNLMMPSNNPDLPFSDVRVRQAIAYAIDTKAIAELMSEQGGDYLAINQIALPGSFSWDDSIEGYPYNPEKAKELLKEAGYADGFSCPQYVIASNNLLKQCADIVAAYLSAVGIKVENQNNDMALVAEMTAGTGQQLDGLVWFCTTVGTNTSDAYEKTFTEEGNTYATITEKPQEMLDAIKAAKAASDEQELSKACQTMVRSLVDNCLIVPIAVQHDGQCVTDYVHNFSFVRGSQYDWQPEGVWMDEH